MYGVGVLIKHISLIWMVIEIFNAPLKSAERHLIWVVATEYYPLNGCVESKTLKKHLDEHPLILVGADFNQEALVLLRAFQTGGVDGHFIWGDIGDPDKLALDLWDHHSVKIGDLLSVRSFLDHNRIFNRPL